MGPKRQRRKHTKTFKERLIEEAAKFQEAADQLPPGTARELLLKRVRQAQVAAQIDEWVSESKALPGELPAVSLGNLLKRPDGGGPGHE